MKLLKALKNKSYDMKGFTLIEILIAAAIIAGLAGLGLFLSFDSYRNYALNVERDILVNVLQKARSLSLNNIDESAYGVYIQNSNFIIFKGDSYVSRDPIYDETIPTNSSVSKSGLQEIVFEQLTANSSASGDIILNNAFHSLIISLNNEGRINW